MPILHLNVQHIVTVLSPKTGCTENVCQTFYLSGSKCLWNKIKTIQCERKWLFSLPECFSTQQVGEGISGQIGNRGQVSVRSEKQSSMGNNGLEKGSVVFHYYSWVYFRVYSSIGQRRRTSKNPTRSFRTKHQTIQSNSNRKLLKLTSSLWKFWPLAWWSWLSLNI